MLLDILGRESDDINFLKLKSNVALELLARAGHGPIKQVQVQQHSTSALFSPEDIELIKERGRKI